MPSVDLGTKRVFSIFKGETSHATQEAQKADLKRLVLPPLLINQGKFFFPYIYTLRVHSQKLEQYPKIHFLGVAMLFEEPKSSFSIMLIAVFLFITCNHITTSTLNVNTSLEILVYAYTILIPNKKSSDC